MRGDGRTMPEEDHAMTAKLIALAFVLSAELRPASPQRRQAATA